MYDGNAALSSAAKGISLDPYVKRPALCPDVDVNIAYFGLFGSPRCSNFGDS